MSISMTLYPSVENKNDASAPRTQSALDSTPPPANAAAIREVLPIII